MPIRTKEECHSTFLTSWSEYHGTVSWICDTVPIRDWKISPSNLQKNYTIGGTPPSQLLFDVTFPELEYVYPAYSSFRYKIKRNFSGTDFVQLTNAKLSGDTFTELNLEQERIMVDFINYSALSPGHHEMNIIIEAYGVSGSSETFLESSTLMISALPISLDVSGTGLTTNKEVLNVTFNKAGSGTFSGDTQLIFYTLNEITYTTTIEENGYISFSKSTVGSTQVFTFQKNYYLSAKAVGSYTTTVTFKSGNLSKIITINMEVIDDSDTFYITPSEKQLSLQKNLSETATDTATIVNPNSLSIAVSSVPSFIDSATISGSTLSFTTKNSASLATGNYEGNIVLTSGSISRTLSLKLSVMDGISHDFSGKSFYFAKDPNKFTYGRTSQQATFVRMTLEMFYNGYGEMSQETEVYSVPFFQNSVVFYPGDEVQDFFFKAKDISEIENPLYLYDLAIVSMKFEEMTDSNIVLSSFTLSNLKFAPGKTPKCFPYFTDYPVRRTFTDSKIQISFCRTSSKQDIDILFSHYTESFPTLPSKYIVDRFMLERPKFKPGFTNAIVQTDILTFIPFPDPQETIHISWENQNLVFDWFTAQGMTWVEKPEIENITGQSNDYEEEKFDSTVSRPVTINTGWILWEEIDMITDLLACRVCFIFINGVRYKAFPTGKKNEMKNRADNTYQMDLEFKILIDER